MVVVDGQLLTTSGRSPANVADASLCLVESLVLLLGQSVPLHDGSAVSGLPEGLLACPMVRGTSWSRVRGGPLRARLTVLTQPLAISGHRDTLPVPPHAPQGRSRHASYSYPFSSLTGYLSTTAPRPPQEGQISSTTTATSRSHENKGYRDDDHDPQSARMVIHHPRQTCHPRHLPCPPSQSMGHPETESRVRDSALRYIRPGRSQELPSS